MSEQKLPILITIATFSNVSEAYFFKQNLENHGITCFLEDENMSVLYSNALGGVRLKVPGNQYEKALNIINKLKKAEEKQNALQYRKLFPEFFVCPSCGHLNHEMIIKSETFSDKFLKLFGINRTKVVCESCAHGFRVDELTKKDFQ